MNLLTYLTECSLALAAFYSVYFIFLRKQIHFEINRLYLMFTLILSIILPFIHIKLSVQDPETISVLKLKEVIINGDNREYNSQVSVNAIITILIGLSIGYFIFRLIKQIYHINALLRACPVKKEENIVIVESNLKESFSFFNFIFIDRSVGSKEREKILLHEKIHVRQWHTVDRLISELVLALLWFNPFVWLYRIAIIETQEFIADQIVYHNHLDRLEYQQLLLNQMFGTDRIQFVQYFNKSLIKKRIYMLTKNANKKQLGTRFLIALPMALIIAVLFAFKTSIPKVTEPVEKILNAVKITENNIPKDTSQVFVVVEHNAKFQGGDINTFRNYLMQNVKYPEGAKKRGIHGRVIVQFVVDYNGDVKNTKLLRALDPECDAEALRVVRTSPKWEPASNNGINVSQQFVLPVVFSIVK